MFRENSLTVFIIGVLFRQSPNVHPSFNRSQGFVLMYCNLVNFNFCEREQGKIDPAGWSVLDLVHYQYSAQIFFLMSLEANLQQMDRLFKQSVLGTDSLDLYQVRVLVQAQWFLDNSSFNQKNIV